MMINLYLSNLFNQYSFHHYGVSNMLLHLIIWKSSRWRHFIHIFSPKPIFVNLMYLCQKVHTFINFTYKHCSTLGSNLCRRHERVQLTVLAGFWNSDACFRARILQPTNHIGGNCYVDHLRIRQLQVCSDKYELVNLKIMSKLSA